MNAYDFSFPSIEEGKHIQLSSFRGKVMLVVNVASECGFTPQYEGLQSLYEKYGDRGLVVIGVPSNDFGGQEPGTEADIQKFCEKRFHVTFPMTAKTKVKGKEAHAFYLWASKTLGLGSAPKWNFHKYLINRDGRLVDYFVSTTKPESKKVVQKIEALLNAPEPQ